MWIMVMHLSSGGTLPRGHRGTLPRGHRGTLPRGQGGTEVRYREGTEVRGVSLDPIRDPLQEDPSGSGSQRTPRWDPSQETPLPRHIGGWVRNPTPLIYILARAWYGNLGVWDPFLGFSNPCVLGYFEGSGAILGYHSRRLS